MSETIFRGQLKQTLADILAVGGNNVKAELLDSSTNVWELVGDYPFVMGSFHLKFTISLCYQKSIPRKATQSIMYTPIIYVKDFFYIFGGYVDENFDNTRIIGSFNPSTRVS